MRVAVALSGGGARCAAQLGYIDAIKELIQVEALAGSSGGAIAAALLAKGYTPKEALEIVESLDYSKIKLKLRGAIFDSTPIQSELKTIGLDNFQTLQKPLFVTLTDYQNLQTRYVSSGDLALALLASAALLPLFAPVALDDRLYIDGGFSDNLPVTPLQKYPFILAINVNPKSVPYPNTLWGNLKRAGYALLNSNIRYSIQNCNHYVEITECANYGILERKKLRELFWIGHEAAKRDRKKWEELCLKQS